MSKMLISIPFRLKSNRLEIFKGYVYRPVKYVTQKT